MVLLEFYERPRFGVFFKHCSLDYFLVRLCEVNANLEYQNTRLRS